MLRSAFARIAPGEFAISSAGTGALVGFSIDAQVTDLIRAFEGDPEDFRARQLEKRILEGQDLILALTREHRSRVIEMSPSLLRQTFTLREFARLIDKIDGDASLDGPNRWRAALPKVVRSRAAHPSAPELDDIVDPYRRPKDVYQQMAQELVPAVKTLVHWEYSHRLQA